MCLSLGHLSIRVSPTASGPRRNERRRETTYHEPGQNLGVQPSRCLRADLAVWNWSLPRHGSKRKPQYCMVRAKRGRRWHLLRLAGVGISWRRCPRLIDQSQFTPVNHSLLQTNTYKPDKARYHIHCMQTRVFGPGKLKENLENSLTIF